MVNRKVNMNKQHNPISYKIGKTLAYLIIAIAATLLVTGSVALLKLFIGFILA